MGTNTERELADPRQDEAIAATVEHGTALLAIAGAEEASRYLRHFNVPEKFISRVLRYAVRQDCGGHRQSVENMEALEEISRARQP